jgi:autotransporter translocation and assembly factor TamB
MRWGMRLVRKLLHVFLIVLMLLVGTAAAAVIVSQTAWFRNRVRVYVVSQASQYLNGDITIDRLSGNLFGGLTLEGFRVAENGQPVLSAQDIGLEYNAYQLLTSNLSINRLSVNKPVLYLHHTRNGWSAAGLIKKQSAEADRSGPLSPITIDDIGISDGSIIVADEIGTPGVTLPKQVDHIDAKATFEYAPVHYSIGLTHLSFRATEPDLALNALSGGIAIRDDTLFLNSLAIRTPETSLSISGAIQQYLSSPVVNLQVSSDKTTLRELAGVVPTLAGVDLQPAFELGLSGPFDQLGVTMNVRSTAGELTGTLLADLSAPHHAASGNVSVRHVNLAPLVNDPRQASDITANAAIDLRSESLSNLDSIAGTVKLDAPHIAASGYRADHVIATVTLAGRRVNLNARGSAYGATATASGRVDLPADQAPLLFDLRGQARHVNIQALPRSLQLPPARTDLTALAYHVIGKAVRSGNPKARSVGLTLDATLADSTVPGAQIASGSKVSVDTRGVDVGYSADASVRGLDLQRVGEAFRIPALADERYQSRIDGHLTITGHGTTLASMEATAAGTMTDASLKSGQLSQTAFDATLSGNTAHVKAVGQFTDVDPATFSGKARLQGMVGGHFDVDVEIQDVSLGVTVDNVSGTAQLTLDRSIVGGLAIDRGNLDADYRNQIAEIRKLELAGPDANLTAQGTVSLGDSGTSNVTFHADSPRLAEIGALFDVPLTGIGLTDGTITGNRSELQASGTVVGDGITYEDNGALTLKSTYTVKVPDLDFSRAAIDADSSATFAKVAGQEINELTAKTSYQERRLAFDGTAKQPNRSLDATGSLLLHPDHQEVHLEHLNLSTANQQWALPQGEQATVNYAHDGVSVDRLHLVSGDQEIVASGRYGLAGEALQVALNNVDLVHIDELLLRPSQFTGRLNATAKIEGTREAPRVSGQFKVENGGFRQYTYESLAGTVDYQTRGITIDARLQQTADQWITAKGYAPTALFTSPGKTDPDTPRGSHVEPTEAADRVDLMIDSSPLGLGIVEGFTNELTNVQGTLEAHVHITGAAEDPHPSGTVSVANGAVSVASTGVTYSHIAGQIDLEPDRVHVDQITLLDNHDSALSLTGDLAVHARDVGNFHLWITSEDFKVVDNALGNLRVQSALELVGELRAPEIRGDFGVSSGRLNLDEMLARIPSAYSTEPIAYVASNGPSADAAQPSIFDALRMNVRLTVPDDLIVNSTGLTMPGSAIDLGAINVTLGGDLTAQKDPSGQIRLTGSVNTVRGTYQFQGRRFEVLRDGGIHFDGLEEFDPRLDLRTHRLIQGVDARVNVRGTLKHPEIALSSTPPMEDADILALVVFNQPLNQLGTGQQMTLIQRASDLATGAVVTQLSQSLAKALNLETFQIDLAGDTGPALTIGQQIGPNLYVKLQQGVGDLSTTNLMIEYALTNWLRLQTNVQQGSSTQQSLFQRNQGTGADLIFLFTR